MVKCEVHQCIALLQHNITRSDHDVFNVNIIVYHENVKCQKGKCNKMQLIWKRLTIPLAVLVVIVSFNKGIFCTSFKCVCKQYWQIVAAYLMCYLVIKVWVFICVIWQSKIGCTYVLSGNQNLGVHMCYLVIKIWVFICVIW